MELPPYPVTIHIVRSPMNAVPWVPNRSMFAILGFDETCTVEAAPADIVAAVIDEPLRRTLLAYPVFTLDTVAADGPALRLAIPRRVEAAETEALVAHLTSLGARLRDSYAAAGLEAGTSMDGDPYRPHLDDEPARNAFAVREASVAHHIRDRKARLRSYWTGRQLVGVVAAIMLLATLAILALAP